MFETDDYGATWTNLAADDIDDGRVYEGSERENERQLLGVGAGH